MLYMWTCYLTFHLIRLFWRILAIGLVCKLLEEVSLFLLKICLCGIVITTLHRGSKDFIFAILFVVQFLMAGSSIMAFLPCFPYVRNILSLLAWLHTYPYIGLWCILEIEILIYHLAVTQSVFSILLGISLHVQLPSSYFLPSTRSKTEQLIDLIDNGDYWEIIDVLTIIVMYVIHVIYKKSHHKLGHTSHFDVKYKLSQTKVFTCVTWLAVKDQ